jgi:hypothetical protein
MTRTRRLAAAYIALAAAVAVLFALNLFWGSVSLAPGAVLTALLGKGGQQMLLLHRVVGIFHRDALCSLQSLTGFLCHLFDVHSAYLL